MSDPLSQSILCPALIGRDAQVAALTRLLDRVCSGHGQIAMISGEAGIGKSRLLAEISAQASQQGCLLLAGRCFETDRAFPYAPVADLLRTYQRRQTAAGEWRGLPGLEALFPELAVESAAPPANVGGAAEQEKRRIFQRFADFLHQQTTGQAQRQPLLVIFEDLHWADDLSLECLHYLARTIAQQPILLLCTYRSDEVQPALRHLLTALQRQRLVLDLPLTLLSPPQIEAMIRAIFAHPQAVRSEFLATLHSLTDGNPFFVEEVLKALVSTGDIFYADGLWTRKALGELHIPPTVQDAVQRRTEQLSPAARQLLTVAAVAGRRCDFTLLQQVIQQEEATVLRLIKELIAAQLLREEAADLFAFRHALTQQAIYSALLSRERKAMHRVVLGVLESLVTADRPSTPAELAYHAQAAEAWDRLLPAAQRAGEQALALYAPQTALEHFRQALRAAQQLQQTPSIHLQRACGQAYTLISDFANARHAYEQALALARSSADNSADDAAEWQCLLDLGTLAQEEDYQQAGDYFQAALALARTRQEPSALAHTLNWLGRWHSMMDQPEAARQLQGEALAIFQTLHDHQGMAVTLSLLGWSNYVAADLYASVAAYSQAIALCRQTDDRPWLIFSLAGRAMRGRDYFNLVACWPPADRAGAERDVAEAIQLAQQMGYRSGEVRTLIWFAVGLGAAGEYGRALSAAHSALQIAREDQQSRYIATVYHALGSLYLDLLALPVAQDLLEACLQRSEVIKSLTMSRYAAGLLAAVAVGQQRLDEAQRLLERALPAAAPTTSKTQRLIGCTRVELLLARDQPGEALAWVDRLLASAVAPPVADPQADEWIIPRLWHLRGVALLALQRLEEAEAVLQTARRVAEAQGMRPLLWRIHASQARLYQQKRRRDLAFSALSAAQTLIEQLALSVDDLPLRQNFVQQASELLPNLSPPTPLRAAKLSSDGLTARERQVGVLIAQGQSNRAIAEGLIVSERTVAKHVENILSKLHFTTRAQIAAWAVEKGLLAEEA